METIRAYLSGRLEIAVGDITRFEGDAIVNAANSALAGGGGVDGAIHSAAGPAVMDECRALRRDAWPDGLPAGRAAVTGAGRLPLAGIIHAVGPVWRGGRSGEEALLASAYRASLELARDRRWRRVAFPAISTGVYGYPKELAARAAFGAAADFLAANAVPETVVFVFHTRVDADVFISTAEASRSP